MRAAILQLRAEINLLGGCMPGTQENPHAIKWRHALQVPNAWTLRNHMRSLPHRQVYRMLRAVLCGRQCQLPPLPVGWAVALP